MEPSGPGALLSDGRAASTETSTAVDVSVLIVNHNHRKYIATCLDSIISNTRGVTYEIIVVDNCSTDGSREFIEKHYPSVRLLANTRIQGLAQNNNSAIRNASGRYMLLLNPDTKIYPGAMEYMVRFMDHHPGVGACGSKLLNADGTLQYSCRNFPTLAAVLFRGLSLARWFPIPRSYQRYLMADWDHNQIREVDWVLGACLMIRPDALKEVGLMDEKFFLYYEEIDWCYRAKKKGWRIVYLPGAEVMHHYLRMSAGGMPGRLTLIHMKSIVRYFRKHFWSIFKDHLF